MSEDFTVERFECDASLDEIRENFIIPNKTNEACTHCRCYDNNWCCPPFTENQSSIWNDYENIKLILVKMNFTDEARRREFTSDSLMDYAFDFHHGQKMLIEPELERLEEKLNGYYLTSGPCVNCNECQRMTGNSCVMPDKRKYAMESLGADVIGIAKKYFDLDLKWIKGNVLPEYIIMMVSVLY